MSALTERIAAEHQPRYVEMRGHEVDDFTYGWRCSCGNALRGGAIHQSMRSHVAEVTEAAVREHIATELEATAREFNATYHRMNDSVIAREAHDFDRDDVIRYGAYTSAWNSAARTARTPTKEL